MPTAFDSQFTASAVPSLFGLFGETITYRPGAGGTRTIEAKVSRTDRTQWAGLDNAAIMSATITVRNDSTTGISATEIDTGGDRIDYQVRDGATATTRSITRVIDTNGSTITFEVG
jgi:hypothetical protein